MSIQKSTLKALFSDGAKKGEALTLEEVYAVENAKELIKNEEKLR